jgi:hypothetical protein
MDYAPCVVHLWPEWGTGRLGAARASAAAGVRGGTSPASGVLATRVANNPLQCAQKEEGCQEVLTEGSWWPELLRRVDVGEVERRRWGGARGPGGAGLLRASGWHGSMHGVAAKQAEGSARSGAQRRRGIGVAEPLTGSVSWVKSRRLSSGKRRWLPRG